MATNEPLRRRVDKLTRLATMPRTVTTVASMIDTGSASTAQISAEIAKDQVIAMQVLKLVNSGFCGFRMPVTSISHATVLIGLDALRMLLFGTTLLNLEATRQMQGFWRHSLGTARAAGVLAGLAGLQKAEEVAVAGLLRLALRAQNVAALTRRLPTTDTEALGARMAAVEAELEALRLESGDDPACRSFVARLRVKLDSTTESDVGRLSEAYVKECEHTANWARDLVSRLADAVARELPPAAAG